MKRTIPILWSIIFGLAACTAPATSQTPTTSSFTPTSPPTHTPSPSPTLSPTQTSSPTPTFTPTVTPFPLPTPTPARLYVHESAAFSLIYPAGWRITEEDEDSVIFANSDDSFFITGYSEPGEESISIYDLIPALQKQFGAPISMENQDDYVLKNGTVAKRAILAYTAGGQERIIYLVRAVEQQKSYIFIGLGPRSSFENNRSAIQKTFESIELRAGLVYGLDRQQTLVLLGADPYPEDLDPARMDGSADEYIGHLYSGLVRLSPQLQVEPDLSESWNISPDGAAYTFTLRSDVAFQFGRPITAEDVKYSWERAADPETESPTVATYLGDIVGVHEKLSGQADEIEGVQVVDEHTLVVRLDGPKPYFLAKLTYPTSYVVDRENVEADPDEWMFSPNASGPYGLREFREEEAIIFERNPAYHTQPAIEHIIYLLYQAGTEISYFQSGEIDITGIRSSDAKLILENPEDPLRDQLYSTTSLCTSYIQLNNSLPPMDDPNFRKALALAVDPEQFNELFRESLSVTAVSILPPSMPGFAPTSGIVVYDPEAARAALAASSYASNPPSIILKASGRGNSDSPLLTTLIDMWRENLGVRTSIKYIDPQSVVEGMQTTEGHVVSMGWCADYPDPENFLDILFHSQSNFNWANYHNPEIDALLEAARTELDPVRRLDMYQQVEVMLMKDYAAIPLFHNVWFALVSPSIQGYTLTPMGAPIVHLLSIEE